MNLKQRFRRWLLDDQAEAKKATEYISSAKVRPMNDTIGGSPNFGGGLSFTLHSASGGQVMQFRRYDSNKDRWDERLYLVPDGEDFSQRVAEIVTLEAIRQ